MDKISNWGICILAFSFFISCSSTKHASHTKLTGNWQAQPIVVDGDCTDWPSPYPSYDSKAMIGYAYSNDKDNLYLTIETGDEMTQLKILKGGLTVWIDTSGKKEQTTAIHFPLENTNELSGLYGSKKETQYGEHVAGENDNTGMGKGIQQRIKRAIGEATQMTLDGFDGCNGGFAAKQTNDCGIVVRIGIDQYNELIWEAAIPFKGLNNKGQLGQSDQGKPISICFSIKGLKRPSANISTEGYNDKMSSGMHGGGMGGGMRGGGMRGGMRNGANGTNPREHLFESTKTWVQLGLAYPAK